MAYVNHMTSGWELKEDPLLEERSHSMRPRARLGFQVPRQIKDNWKVVLKNLVSDIPMAPSQQVL